MNFKIIYEDENLLVIDKPAGIEVSELPYLPAHRLDKDTSGLLVIAKNQDVLEKLQDQFKKRQVNKVYLALVYGEMAKEGELVTEIVRDPSRKVPFKAVAVASGLERGDPRVAKTAWRVMRYISLIPNPLSLASIKITTGRTHQIRVHMKYLDHPIMGDATYFTKPSRDLSKKLGFTRQFLHAAELEFTHPVSGKKLRFSSELPADLAAAIRSFRV
ncbi:RluA family pseudouridine synthase [Candidatus Berkelbacteria bacterium]|nr:RluA family pseudouridine synthase [Candidatus Berkelbacteria bacterium]